MASVTRKPLRSHAVEVDAFDAFDAIDDEPAGAPWPCTKGSVFLSGWRQNCPVGMGEALVVGWLPPTEFPPTKLRIYEKQAQSSAFVAMALGRERRSADAPSDLRTQFDGLVRIWVEETLASSSVIEICTHWAYQRVIGLGPNVIPLILKAISDGHRHWGWALAALTGENPAADTQTQQEAADAWLNWGADYGYLKRDPQRVD